MSGVSGATRTRARSLMVLLDRIVDYAGLFPPAALGMREAARNFAAYAASGDAWALGRFVVPAARLEELASATAELPAPNVAWPLSVLVGPALEEDAARVAAFAARVQRFTIAAVEGRAESDDDVYGVCRALPPAPERFVEIPPTAGVDRLTEALRVGRASAKVRTGGVTPAAFPAAADVVSLLRACRLAGIAFKATAGLHHPVRAEYPLTYEAGCAVGTMFGFLNVLMAAAFTWHCAHEDVVLGALLERDAGAFQFSDDAASWNGHVLPIGVLRESRERFARAIGSCSFEDPLRDLGALGLL